MGVVPLSHYELIDERKLGFMTLRLELMFERQGTVTCVRLRGSEFKGSGSTGLTRKAFDWPVADPARPIELVALAERILAAAAPDAEVHDPRGFIGRGFDGLFRLHFLNHVPEVATCERDGRRHVISARLYQEKDDVQVTLTHEVPGRSPLWFRLPLEAVRRLRERAAQGFAIG